MKNSNKFRSNDVNVLELEVVLVQARFDTFVIINFEV